MHLKWEVGSGKWKMGKKNVRTYVFFGGDDDDVEDALWVSVSVCRR